MANSLTGFDPDLFRANILNTMIMGLPVAANEQPTFHFPSVASYPTGTLTDSEGRPIDPRIKPTSRATQAPLQVPCAVEFTAALSDVTGLVGTHWESRAIVTLLDTQYALVQAAIEVDLATRRYLIQEMTEVGLGPVTVYQLVCFRKGVDTA